jgi:uncharacterized membrane protein YeaQ/YmgE (transglycosylase-associated protein family)
VHFSNERMIVILLVGAVAGYLSSKVVRGADFEVVGDACVGIVGAMIGDWLLPRFNVRFVGGVMGLAVEADRGSRAVAGSALGWRERMGRGSLGVRRSAARLLLTKRELSRFADGLRSKV